MRESRRQFLRNSAVALGLSALSRAGSVATPGERNAPAAESPADQRLQTLLDTLFERVLEISPQLVVTLGRDTGVRSQARMHLDEGTSEGQARRKDLVATNLTELRAFDPSGLPIRGWLDYESVLFSTGAETISTSWTSTQSATDQHGRSLQRLTTKPYPDTCCSCHYRQRQTTDECARLHRRLGHIRRDARAEVGRLPR